MVFTNLSYQEKDAFFSLMDEFSRPELAAKLSSGSGSGHIDVGGAMNRVASAAHSFGQHMPAPPRRSPTQPPPDRTPAGLMSTKRFGDVDTTSKATMLMSSISSKKKGNPISLTPPPPPAFAAPKNTFAPPPRRTVSTTPEPEPQAPSGEWAEALYDYESAEAGDLNIKANQRLLVTEKSSADWWTGEVNGKSGLFPASNLTSCVVDL
ncbi:SH3 domain-containing protein [Mucidula mucida]|nr:SH3 domain-containing protein [Mucidula mucida]